MKLQGLAYILGASLLGIGVATAVTNPAPDRYEAFAAQKLSAYLQQNVCGKAGVLEDTCGSAIKDNQPQLKKFIADNTQRQNFLFWSVYKTDLAPGELLPPVVGSLLPAYHFETVGVFSSFHIYKADKVKG